MATHHEPSVEVLAPRSNADSADTIDDTIVRSMSKELKYMVESVQSLAADPSFKSLYERIDRVRELDEKIKEKDELIAKLQLELANNARSHIDMQQESLRVYELKYEGHKTAYVEAQRKIEDLQEQLRRNEKTIETLKKEKLSMAEKISELEKSIKMKKNEAENALNSMRELRIDLKTSREAKEKAQNAIRNHQARVKQVQAEMETLQKASHSWETRAKAAEQQVKEFNSLTVKLDDSLPLKAMERLSHLWMEAAALISSTFFRDAPDDAIQDKSLCSGLENPTGWRHFLPLPKSNSDAAKQMRCVVIMGQLARSTANHVLQPTHLFQGNGCIGSVLTRQAKTDSRKESAIRGMLQAMLPDEHDVSAAKAIGQACNEVMVLARRLLSQDQSVDFENKLRALVEEACATWREICRSEFAIEPSFEEYILDRNWYELWFESGKPVISQQKSHDAVERDRVAVVVFPSLIVTDEESQGLESHGTFFMKSQTRIAQEEFERPSPSSGSWKRSPTAGRGLTRIRKTSTEGPSIPNAAVSQSFLG